MFDIYCFISFVCVFLRSFVGFPIEEFKFFNREAYSSIFGNALRLNMKIIEVTYLSTAIKQIRFKGDISKWNFQAGYANVIRINDTEFSNYTVAAYNLEESTFDIILG